MIDASFLPVDSTVGEVEVGISNLLAMNELLTKVVSRTMEININQHGLYKPILTIDILIKIYVTCFSPVTCFYISPTFQSHDMILSRSTLFTNANET